ncbi:MAG: tetratricopeptide repeat protein [Bryobacteraceae bacterium]
MTGPSAAPGSATISDSGETVPTNWGKVKEIFSDAVEVPDAGRAAFLDRACAGDTELRSAVERLLAQVNETGTEELLPAASHQSLTPGNVLSGRFRIKRLAGEGGMGEVYEAEDLELGGSVALKTLRPSLLEDPLFLGRFRREVQLARQVTHHNICRIFDVGHDHGRVYLTMEFLEGETLAQHLRRVGKLGVDAALPIARQMIDGLAALHGRGIVHRDFKPGNVILTQDSGGLRAVIGDFGLARAFSGDGTRTALSTQGHVMGTPDYMSPEQLRGDVATPASDLYALGLVLYEMVAGRKAYPGGQALENAVQRVLEPPTPPRQWAPELSPSWEAAILRCLERAPEDRPPSAAEVVGQLTGTTPIPKTRAAKQRLWRWVAAAAIFFLLAVAAFVWRPRLTVQPGTDRQHVVVLPFRVLGDEPELRVFADGLMETITSRMSQYEGPNSQLLVVPASEVRQQGAKNASDSKTKFGASTAVEGSLQAQGNRIRLLLTLVDIKQMRQAGTVLVEEQRSNAVSLQDAAVIKLANALNLNVQPRLAREMQQVNPIAPGAHEFYLQARGYLQRTDQLSSIDSAISLAKRALEADSGYALAHSALGLAYWHKYELTRDPKFVEQAISSGRKGVELNSGLPETHVSIGRIHLGTGRNQEALTDFEKALSIDDRNTEAYQGLATAYANLKQYEKAEATYRKAIALRPGDWNGYRQLGLYYYQRGDYDHAIEQYERVVSLAPDNAMGYVNLGVLHFLKGSFEKARANWQRALELDPDRVSTLQNLAKLEDETGKTGRAIELWQHALKVNPRSFRIWQSLAAAYERTGDRERKREALNEAIRLVEAEILVNPNQADLYTYLAHYRAMAGSGSFEDLLQKAIKLAPNNPDVLVRAAETYAMTGQEQRALDYIRSAMANGYSADALKQSRTLRALIPLAAQPRKE